MTDQLRYVGGLPGKVQPPKSNLARLSKRIPVGLALVVGVPTVLACLYWGVIASPRYVSEAHFTVRKTDASRPNNLGLVLQNVGLSAGTSESFAVQDFVTSRDAAKQLHQEFNLDEVFTRNGADIFSRHPGIFSGETDEGRYKTLKRYVKVTYNGTSGITKLSVQAFTPQDARNLNLALLAAGEQLVNRLNERAAKDAVVDAEQAVQDATAKRSLVQAQLTEFRNRERFVDPQMTAAESTQLISGLLATAAGIRAELSELRRSAPQSPQIPILAGRLSAYEGQIAEARAELVGEAESLVPKLSAYEGLVLQRELADRALTEASAGLITAQQSARRQKLYLDRIVEPNLSDKSTQPHRLRSILIVFLSSFIIYVLGRLLWAGLREHRQE
ncbi:chain-length determining protein [Brevundimonas terrae]|uniref:chain-length determining protein n=1 Tax=Brevundimonas terrae TaxID=363631 RepID=UPI00141E6699|nr:chain-length determining protein [Brevundimonas terrae]NIJ25625.1 capsular polysaccharide transport system permease protein [Brevundimonas terrae]